MDDIASTIAIFVYFITIRELMIKFSWDPNHTGKWWELFAEEFFATKPGQSFDRPTGWRRFKWYWYLFIQANKEIIMRRYND